MNALIRSLATHTYPDLPDLSVGVALVGEGDHPRPYLCSIHRSLGEKAPRRRGAEDPALSAAPATASPKTAPRSVSSPGPVLRGRLGTHEYLLPEFGRSSERLVSDSFGHLRG